MSETFAGDGAGEWSTLHAPAKLTLSLRVTGVRDDGYHLIDAEMVTLDFGDILEIRELPAGSPSEVTVHRGSQTTEADPADLVYRALALVGRSAQIRLTKLVPPGAGLGGGSADAAAVLRWAGFTDLSAAATIGADVPFCLVGSRARVTGIGEVVEELPARPMVLTLLTPGIHASTPVVYAEWDRLGAPTGENHNDLEPAALSAYPELAGARDELAVVSGLRPCLAGSGSTWWVEGEFPGAGRVVTRTVSPGERD